MKKIYVYLSCMALAACGNSENQPEAPATATSTEQTTSSAMSPLDSIDQNNANIIIDAGDDVEKAYVYLSDGDSTIYLITEGMKDYRIFGFAEPDITSERLLAISILTSDVENNPFNCKLGAFYHTDDMEGISLNYVATEGDFVKALALQNDGTSTTLYFESSWIVVQ